MRVVCPAGFYCPQGTGANWMACPRGTYSNTSGLYEEAQCTPCDAGKYCETEHLTQPTGKFLVSSKHVIRSKSVLLLKRETFVCKCKNNSFDLQLEVGLSLFANNGELLNISMTTILLLLV